MSENKLIQHIQQEVSFQKLKLLSGQSIGIRKWLMKEEKEFLFAIETQMDNNDLLIDECLSLSRKCVDDVALFDTLSKNDLAYAISKQRALSKGEEITFIYKCSNPKCETFTEYDEKEKERTGRKGEGDVELEDIIDLKQHAKTTMFDYTPIEVGIYKFTLKDLPFAAIRLMEKEFLSAKKPELFKLNNAFVLNSIDIVEIEGEVYKEFTRMELTELLDTFSHDEFTKLSNGVGSRISSFVIDKEVACDSCGDSNKVVYEEIFSLLVF